MEITVIKAMPADAATIATLFDKYRVFYGKASDLQSAETFIQERLHQDESVIFLAFLQGNAVGFTQLYPIFTSVGMQRTWLLNDLFVDGSARKRGVGEALLNAAKKFAKDTNSKWLLLQTGAENKAAQALYEKLHWNKVTDVFYELPV